MTDDQELIVNCRTCGGNGGTFGLCAPCALTLAEGMERQLFRLLDAQNIPPVIRTEDGDRYATVDEWPEDPALDAKVQAADDKLASFVQYAVELLRGTRFERPPDDRSADGIQGRGTEPTELLRAAPGPSDDVGGQSPTRNDPPF